MSTSRNAMSREQRNALLAFQRVAQAIVETVDATPDGAPGGPMYAAVMAYMNLEQFDMMMRVLVNAGRITKRGDLYFPAGDPK